MGVLSSQLKVIKTHIDDAKDAINVKYEETNKPPIKDLKTGEIADRVLEIPALDTSDATATSADILYPRTAYVNQSKIEGTIQSYDTAYTVLSIVDNKVSHDDSPAFTCNLPYTGYFTSDSVLILKASDLKNWGLTPEKITKGETWMGIEGTGGVDTTDATAIAEDILTGKTAYVNDEKVTGTMKELNGPYSWPRVIFPATQPTVNYPDNPGSISYNLRTSTQYDNAHIGPNTKFELRNMDLISFLGISADKIKKGESISYVQGTYDGLDTSDATATPEDMRVGETAYVNGEKITGKLNSWAVSRLGIKKTNAASFNLDIEPGIFTESSTVILNFSDIVTAIALKPEDIVDGRTILGIKGTAKSGVDTSDATALASDIVKDKTAYVNGVKVKGTLNDYSDATVIATSATNSTDGIFVDLFGRAVYEKIGVHYDIIAEAIGLTASQIKKGEVVLGITGTYDGNTSTPGNPEIEFDDVDPTKSYYNYSASSHLFHSGSKWGYWEILLGAPNHVVGDDYSNADCSEAYVRMYVAHKLNGQNMDGYFVEDKNTNEHSYHNVYYEFEGTNYLTCYVGDLDLTIDECNYIYKCLRYDSPELMMKFTGFKYFYNSQGYVTYLLFDTFDEATREAYMDACQESFEYICALIYANYGLNTSLPYQSYGDSYDETYYTREQKAQIAKVIHDYLVLNNTYHSSSVENLDQTMYPALSRGAETPVCASYAHAFQWCCQKFGITCYVVNGSTDSDGTDPHNGRHLWNMINYENYPAPTISNMADDNIWYEVDVTWDDPTNEGESYCQWNFFNTTTAYIQSSAGGNRVRSYRNVTNFGNEAFYSFITDNCTATEFKYTGSEKYGGM